MWKPKVVAHNEEPNGTENVMQNENWFYLRSQKPSFNAMVDGKYLAPLGIRKNPAILVVYTGYVRL